MKAYLGLTLIAGGVLMALFFARESYWIFFGTTEGLHPLDYLYFASPTVFALAVAFTGWRLYRSTPITSQVEK